MVKPQQMQLINGLGYAGLLPFVATAIASYWGISVFGLEAADWFVRYSAVILVFLSGSLWGVVLNRSDSRLSLLILALSNVLALAAWLALGLSDVYFLLCLTLLALGYAAVLGLEIALQETLYNGITPNYSLMRLTLTVIVIALHGVMFLSYFYNQ